MIRIVVSIYRAVKFLTCSQQGMLRMMSKHAYSNNLPGNTDKYEMPVEASDMLGQWRWSHE